MMNPATMMKLMSAEKKFNANHPKFIAFLKYVLAGGFEEGTVVEIMVQKPGQDPVTTNLKVTESDLELFESLKDLKM